MDREAILRRFETLLDSALAEDPPRGIPEELLADGASLPAADFYSMQAALTALTQEIKLQGRAFKQLSETLAPVAAAAPGLEDLFEKAREKAQDDVLEALLDMRDRLARGLASSSRAAAGFESPEGGWRSRLAVRLDARSAAQARETVAALQEGYRMTAARLEEVLLSFGISEIECLDQPFDPGCMNAVDTEETARVPEGTVVEIYRPGYERAGEVFRPAQVRVARRPAPVEEERA